MNDLATTWISPFWQTWTFGGSDDWQQSTVYVVNPGATAATLKIRWMGGAGGLVGDADGTPPAGTFWGWSSPLVAERGWLLVTSDEPVAPWGTTTPNLVSTEPLPMSFYRAEDSVVRAILSHARIKP